MPQMDKEGKTDVLVFCKKYKKNMQTFWIFYIATCWKQVKKKGGDK